MNFSYTEKKEIIKIFIEMYHDKEMSKIEAFEDFIEYIFKNIGEEDYIEFLKYHFYDVCEEMGKNKNYDLEDAIKKLIWVLADLAIFENEGCYESEFMKKLGCNIEIDNDMAYEIFYESETMAQATEIAKKLLKN